MVNLLILLTKQLIFDGRKNKILNNKINLKIPIVYFMEQTMKLYL